MKTLIFSSLLLLLSILGRMAFASSNSTSLIEITLSPKEIALITDFEQLPDDKFIGRRPAVLGESQDENATQIESKKDMIVSEKSPRKETSPAQITTENLVVKNEYRVDKDFEGYSLKELQELQNQAIKMDQAIEKDFETHYAVEEEQQTSGLAVPKDETATILTKPAPKKALAEVEMPLKKPEAKTSLVIPQIALKKPELKKKSQEKNEIAESQSKDCAECTFKDGSVIEFKDSIINELSRRVAKKDEPEKLEENNKSTAMNDEVMNELWYRLDQISMQIMEMMMNQYSLMSMRNFYSPNYQLDMSQILLNSIWQGTYWPAMSYQNSIGLNPYATTYSTNNGSMYQNGGNNVLGGNGMNNQMMPSFQNENITNGLEYFRFEQMPPQQMQPQMQRQPSNVIEL